MLWLSLLTILTHLVALGIGVLFGVRITNKSWQEETATRPSSVIPFPKQ